MTGQSPIEGWMADYIVKIFEKQGFTTLYRGNKFIDDTGIVRDHDLVLISEQPKRDIYIAIQLARKSEKYVNLQKVGKIASPLTYLKSNASSTKIKIKETSPRVYTLYEKVESTPKPKAFSHKSEFIDDMYKAVLSARALIKGSTDKREKVIFPLVIVATKYFRSGLIGEPNPDNPANIILVAISRISDTFFMNANYGSVPHMRKEW